MLENAWIMPAPKALWDCGGYPPLLKESIE